MFTHLDIDNLNILKPRTVLKSCVILKLVWAGTRYKAIIVLKKIFKALTFGNNLIYIFLIEIEISKRFNFKQLEMFTISLEA